MPHIGLINPFVKQIVKVPAALTFVDQPFQPVDTTCWQGGTFTVRALDSMGNPDPSYDGPITISLQNNPTGAILFGTLTVTASLGSADFTNWNIDRNGTGYTLKASTATTTVISAPFNVTGASDTAVCSPRSYTNAPAFTLNVARYAVIMTWLRDIPPGGIGTGFQGGDMITVGGSAGSIGENGNGPSIIHRFNGANSTASGGFVNLDPTAFTGTILQYNRNSGTYPAVAGPWHQDIVSYDTLLKTVQWMSDGVLLTVDVVGGPAAGPLTFNGIDMPQVVVSAEGPVSDSFIALSNDHGLDLSDPETKLLFRTLAGKPVDLSGGVPGYSTLLYLRGRSSNYLTDSDGSAGALSTIGAFGSVPIMDNTNSTPWP